MKHKWYKDFTQQRNFYEMYMSTLAGQKRQINHLNFGILDFFQPVLILITRILGGIK